LVFTLSRKQFTAFEDVARDRWCETAAQDLCDTFRPHYAAMGASPETLIPLVNVVADWARRYQVTGRADVTRLCHVAAALGSRFWQDPRFRGLVEAAMSPDIPPGRRATAMTGQAKTWLRGLWAADSPRAFSERLAERVRTGHGPQPHCLQDVVPGHWRMFSATDNDRLLAWLAHLAPDTSCVTAHQRLAHSACALVYGVQWLNDPQYPRLSQAVCLHSDPDTLAQTLIDIHAEASA